LILGVSIDPPRLGLSNVVWSELGVALLKMLSSATKLTDADGTSVRFVWAAEGADKPAAEIRPMMKVRIHDPHGELKPSPDGR
jgi:hypothetical protein